MASKLVGNQFWKLRTTHGRTKLFGGDGAVLWEEAVRYFDWCDRNPWQKSELVKYKGDYEIANVPLGRPYTMDGLTVYLGVSPSYFRSAKANVSEKIDSKRATPEELLLMDVYERIENTVRTQQIEGGTVGVFNAAIIARLNGLAENVNNNNTGDAVIHVSVRDKATANNMDMLEDLL